jgi:dienelactone hydrolase
MIRIKRRNYRFPARNARHKCDWQMIYYANAVHGFTNPEYGNDNSKVLLTMKKLQTLFEHLKLFLNEVLKK